MARKKKTPSDADQTPDVPESVSDTAETPSKAGAISGAVKDADFDTPDAAMADTSLDPDAGTSTSADDGPDAPAEASTDPSDAAAEAGEIVDDDVTVDAPIEADTASDTVDKQEPAADVETAVVVTPPPPPPPPAPQKSGFAGPFLGGVIAAAIGFGGAIFFEAAEWPVFGGGKGADLEALVSEQSAQLQGLSETLASLNAQFEEAQAQEADAFAALEARIDEIPAFGDTEVLPEELRATLAAQKAEMDALQDNLNAMAAMAEQQIAAAQAEQEDAAAAQARVAARGAMNELRTALTTGAPFASVLSDIEAATDVPDALAAQAESGVPTADALEDGFASAARTALSSSLKATAGDAPTDRLALFLKDQLGARSLTPREGDDPDAVLSRAEAAVKSGDLDGALATIEALPEAGQADLEEWAAQARTRKDALAAFDTLSAALSGN